jgi:iron complex outermembrane receptor protein
MNRNRETMPYRHTPDDLHDLISFRRQQRLHRMRSSSLLFSLWFFGATLGLAQNASISGTVTDPQHAAVAQAAVQIVNLQTNDKITTATDQAGAYQAQSLRPGQYKIVVKAPGFSQPESAAITLAEGQALVQDVQLTVASARSVVNVNDQAEIAAHRSDYVEDLGPLSTRPAIDTPYTIFTLPEETLQNTLVTNSFMVERELPGTGIDDFARNSQSSFVGFRGIQGVMLINGMRQGDFYGSFIENTSAVQVLSGYSSFLYGMSTIGGLEDFQLKRPPSQFSTAITLEDVETRGFHGIIDHGGTFDKGIFGYRVVLMGQDGGTAVDDQQYKKHLESLGFDFKPKDWLQIYTDVYQGETRLNGLQTGFYSGGLPILLPLLDPVYLWTPEDSFSDVKSLYWSVRPNIRINKNFSIRSGWDHKASEFRGIYAYNDVQLNAANTAPVTFTEDDTFGTASRPSHNGGYAYLDGKFSAHGISNSFFAGINGYLLHNRSPLFNDPYAGTIDTFETNQVGNYVGTSIAPYYPWGDFKDVQNLYIPNFFNNLMGWAQSGTTSIYSLVVGDTITLGKHVILMAGMNYAGIHSVNYNALTGARTVQDKEHSWSPSASALYKPIEKLTAYFTYMQSVTPGPIVAPTYQNANEILAPYRNYEYEEGVKYQLPKGALLTASWYNLNIESALSSNYPLVTGIYAETGREVHKGLDTTISGKVTSHLMLLGGYSFLHARYTKQEPTYLDGQPSTEEPPHLFKMTAEYQPLLKTDFFLTGGTYFNGTSPSSLVTPTDPYDPLYPGYVQVDLGARYSKKYEKFRMTYRLNVMNLNNTWQTSYGDFNHVRSYNFGTTIAF